MAVRLKREDHYQPAARYASDGGGGFSFKYAFPFWFVVIAALIAAYSGSFNFKGESKPLPVTGPMVVNQQLGAATSPLTVRTPPGDKGRHYLVKFVRAGDQNIAVMGFVRAGETLVTRMPPGTYRMLVASGETWQGLGELFGVGTTLTAATRLISFQPNRGQIIDLGRTPNGNLPMEAANRF